MSVQAISWALAQKIGSSNLKLVLIVLANRAGFENTCFPSMALIAAEAELSRRSIVRALHELEERGLIERAPRMRSGGGKASNVYRLTVTSDQCATLSHRDVPTTTDRCAKSGGRCDTAVTSLNRHLEPSNNLRGAIASEGKSPAPQRMHVAIGSKQHSAWSVLHPKEKSRLNVIPARDGGFWVPAEWPPDAKLL